EGLPQADQPPAKKVPLFGALPTPARHAEQPFDDFALQPLLPNRLSLDGPAMAWGDVDGNGRPDFFLGGGAGSPGQLWIQPGERNLKRVQQGVFAPGAQCEDVDAALFDADGDGDPDLYVVSGGVETGRGSDLLQDRLFLNTEGNFTLAPDGALPDLRFSGSCVAPGDLDGDGDLDLFVGARVIPGHYPTSDRSRLLINEGKARYSEAGPEMTAPLGEAGMVTDALWSDADADGDPDLLVTTEYGPVKLFRNDDGKLTEATEAA
ncbi:MAG: VCBS repeat-containing protein, partial [Akkermansiaceae bacterium]|nr:VCBS repeat-containing protein [Akkermansiaceae bacterium]